VTTGVTRLEVGDPAPLFVGRTTDGEEWWLSAAAGTRTVLTFADDTVTVGWPDPLCSITDDGSIADGYGLRGTRATVVLDERLRVLAVLADDTRVPDVLAQPPDDIPPPILVVPRVFEVDFCDRLVSEYDQVGGTDSGFVRTDEHGRTVPVVDHVHKRRGDLIIDDPELRAGMKDRLQRRLLPEIRRAFQFTATRVERYLVARYGVDDHFRPHRDNTTKGTAHRRFAVTINLNDGYTGGELRFPEFGQRTHRAPRGGAIVFSCSLLHEATPVTEGRRYCTVPFLYDEAGEAVRQQNLIYVAR
jgi:2-oxoglutarate-Fe(II)-dependent oxygenase superfamily protein